MSDPTYSRVRPTHPAQLPNKGLETHSPQHSHEENLKNFQINLKRKATVTFFKRNQGFYIILLTCFSTWGRYRQQLHGTYSLADLSNYCTLRGKNLYGGKTASRLNLLSAGWSSSRPNVCLCLFTRGYDYRRQWRHGGKHSQQVQTERG